MHGRMWFKNVFKGTLATQQIRLLTCSVRHYESLSAFGLLPLPPQFPKPNIHQKHDLAQIVKQRDRVKEITVCRARVDPEVIKNGAENRAPDEDGGDEEPYFRNCLEVLDRESARPRYQDQSTHVGYHDSQPASQPKTQHLQSSDTA